MTTLSRQEILEWRNAESSTEFERKIADLALSALDGIKYRALLEAMLERMTDGRDEADAATLEEWSDEIRAMLQSAKGEKA